MPAVERARSHSVPLVAATGEVAAAALALALLLLTAGGCGWRREAAEPLMLDCQFQIKGLVHLHLSERQGSAHLLTRYRPGTGGEHAEHLRAAVESKGRLVAPGRSRHRIEIFLRNDSFGERPAESVNLNIERDGRSRLEASLPGEAARVIDYGVCAAINPQG